MTAIELKHEANLQQWSQAIRDCRASGLTVKAWCKMHGITATTYYRWERAVLSKIQAPTEMTRAVSFAELPAPAQMQHTVAQQVATVRYNDVSLDIYPSMDADTLQFILSAIRSC